MHQATFIAFKKMKHWMPWSPLNRNIDENDIRGWGIDLSHRDRVIDLSRITRHARWYNLT